jgi:hypothetical protein
MVRDKRPIAKDIRLNVLVPRAPEAFASLPSVDRTVFWLAGLKVRR